MPSVVERPIYPKLRARPLWNVFEVWNRKLHFYIGLYLLFFIWLFAFTGLLLNHPGWTFAEFWPNRKQSDMQRSIQPPPAGGDLVQARDIMRQLGVEGEIEWTKTRSDPGLFEFQATRPGHAYRIKADLIHNRVSLHTDDLNAWGVMHVLHTFTGVRLESSANQRDWALTTVWAFAMDAVALGLLLMVFSSLYMWYRLQRKRWLGVVSLGLGTLTCALFVIGLRVLTR